MSANDMQVGGTHYKTGYEHWDLMIKVGLGNGHLVGSATKYVARWRNKGGVEDLKKALHYVQKMRENWRELRGPNYQPKVNKEMEKFSVANALGAKEKSIIIRLMTWRAPETLDIAYMLIKELIDEAQAQKAVPLEDSNKHAERE